MSGTWPWRVWRHRRKDAGEDEQTATRFLRARIRHLGESAFIRHSLDELVSSPDIGQLRHLARADSWLLCASLLGVIQCRFLAHSRRSPARLQCPDDPKTGKPG